MAKSIYFSKISTNFLDKLITMIKVQ